MTVHQHNESQDEAKEESLSDFLRGKGMKQILAWIPPDATKESKRKASERARRKQEADETQINFMMTTDKDARATVRAVAAAVRDPQIRSAIVAVAAGDPWLHRMVNQTSVTQDNFQPRAGTSEAADVSREQLRSAIETVIENELVRELIRQIKAAPELAALLAEVVRRDDLKGVVMAAVQRPALADTLSAISKAGDSALLNVAYAIRSPKVVETARIAARNPLLETAVAGAIRAPDAVSRAVSVLEAGGIRAKILGWLLGL